MIYSIYYSILLIIFIPILNDTIVFKLIYLSIIVYTKTEQCMNRMILSSYTYLT